MSSSTPPHAAGVRPTAARPRLPVDSGLLGVGAGGILLVGCGGAPYEALCGLGILGFFGGSYASTRLLGLHIDTMAAWITGTATSTWLYGATGTAAFFYNTTITRVNVNMIHNVYVHP